MEPLMIQVQKFQFKNLDCTSNLIRYITRTRTPEPKSNELLMYGFCFGNNYQKPIETVIHEFEFIQKFYKAKGSLMCHYVIHISPELFAHMNNDIGILGNYGHECCQYLFNLGHQACFAIHYSAKQKLHIHLAINAVNFTTGYKLRQYPSEIKKTVEYPLKKIAEKYSILQKTFTDIYVEDSSLNNLC